MQKVVLNLFEPIRFPILKDIINIYNYSSHTESFKDLEKLPIYNGLNNYINELSSRVFKHNFTFISKNNYPKIEIENSNKVLVLFSGGKDSTALAIRLKELKYDVELFTLYGINTSYLDELQRARDVADYLELPLTVKYIEVKGTTDFLENPTKNHLILSYAINYGIGKGINQYAFGGFQTDDFESLAVDRNFSDSTDMMNIFENAVKDIFPNFKLHILFKDEVETLEIIGKDLSLSSKTQSCLTPFRYRKHLHESNCKKYDVELLPNRCGSCWKCCQEYIVFSDLDYIIYNERFYEHCLDIFQNKLKEEKPNIEYTKSRKDVYLAFLETDRLLNKSKYFNKFEKEIDKEKIKIRLATIDDLKAVMILWDNNYDVMGPYWKIDIIDEIENERMFVAEYDNIIIGFVSYYILKRSGNIKIDGICTNSSYRNLGIGKKLIEQLKLMKLPIELDCLDGAENNHFYDKIGKVIGTRLSKKKDKTIRTYLLN